MNCCWVTPQDIPEATYQNKKQAHNCDSSAVAVYRHHPNYIRWLTLRTLLISLTLGLTLITTPSDATNHNTKNAHGVTTIAKTFHDECRQKLGSTTNVHLKTNPNHYRFNDPLDALIRLSSEHFDGGHIPLGLTSASRSVRVRWEQKALVHQTTGQACADVDMHVTIEVPPQTVYVAKELQQGSCPFEFVLEHELKHVYANLNTAEKTANFSRDTLAENLSGYVFFAESKERLENDIKTYMQYKVQPWIERMLSEVDTLHDLIDSPQEYARTNEVCNGVIPKILSRHRLQHNSRRIRELRESASR